MYYVGNRWPPFFLCDKEKAAHTKTTMGAAASLELTPETKDILSAESGKDLNAADVTHPRESAEAEGGCRGM